MTFCVAAKKSAADVSDSRPVPAWNAHDIFRERGNRICMRKTILVLAILFSAFGIAQSKDFEAVKKAGDYSVTIKMDKPSPTVGQNRVEAVINDTQGKEVKDAAIVVEYTMPAMSGMPAMHYKAKAKYEGGRYTAVIDLSMAGPWTITVKFTRGSKTQSVGLTVDVR